MELCTRFPAKYYGGWNVLLLSPADQLLMTLVKVRCYFSIIDSECRFQVSAATVRNVTRTWLSILHEVLLVGLMERPGVLAEHEHELDTHVAHGRTRPLAQGVVYIKS